MQLEKKVSSKTLLIQSLQHIFITIKHLKKQLEKFQYNKAVLVLLSSSSYSWSWSVSGPFLRSSFRAALNILLFPLSSTSCSKLLAVKEDLLGRRMLPAVLNNLSAAAELGRAVLYRMNSLTQVSWWPSRKCSLLTTCSLVLTQLMAECLMLSSRACWLGTVAGLPGPPYRSS